MSLRNFREFLRMRKFCKGKRRRADVSANGKFSRLEFLHHRRSVWGKFEFQPFLSSKRAAVQESSEGSKVSLLLLTILNFILWALGGLTRI